MLEKQQKRLRRQKRTRAKFLGTTHRPRLSVFRSLKHIYAQIIDDEKKQTIVAASDLEFKKSKSQKLKVRKKETKEDKEKKVQTRKVAIAYKVGRLIAEKALKKKIKKVVFDRGPYKYHGRVQALAEGAREGGLEF